MSYTILGSGIIGIYTTFHLLDSHVPASNIKIIAEYLPGDQSIHFTSPWAGGNFSRITSDDDETLKFDKYTYTNLHRIKTVLGDGCGLDNRYSTEFWDTYPGEKKIQSLKSYLIDFQEIAQKELPSGVAYGIRFKSWNFNCPVFLLNMKNYLESKGVTFIRKKVSNINELYNSDPTHVVFNCSGIGASKLGGVLDVKVHPTRGQVVVISAPHIQENKMRWGDDYATYIIPRPDSALGEVILGGFLQAGDWTADTLKEQSDDILKRTKELYPELGDDVKIMREAAGLRPSRSGGVRIERVVDQGQVVVHNYGASGYGYQAGFGMSFKAVQLALKTNTKL